MITLGYIPSQLTVAVSDDTDFVAKLTADPPWEDGTILTLEFLAGGAVTHTWSATVADGDAVWDIPAATVTSLITSTSRDARLLETTGEGASQVRAKGVVKVH